jgi:hypothetical protein
MGEGEKMNVQPEPETPSDVPEADALEQRKPALPEASEEPVGAGQLPDDAPEADVIEQRTDVGPVNSGSLGMVGGASTEAAEADLVEQAMASSFDDEEDYPEAREEDI